MVLLWDTKKTRDAQGDKLATKRGKEEGLLERWSRRKKMAQASLLSFAFSPRSHFTVTPRQGCLRLPPRLAFWWSGLLLTGTEPLFDVAHCLASGTEVILLSKGMTYPSRCHYSFSGIHRDISLIGQVFYGAFLVPCSFSEGYKLVEPCFYFFHHLKAIPFFFLIYRLSLAQNKCSINICWIDFPVWLWGRKTLLLYTHNSCVWLLLNSFLTLGYASGSAAEYCLSQ